MPGDLTPIDYSVIRYLIQPVVVKILMVTDNDGSFGLADFGLSTVVEAMQHDPWWWVKFEITRAHRGTDVLAHANPDPKYRPEFENFTFTQAGLNLKDYQQIWLFGVATPGELARITAAELKAIAQFMDGGGGVFATGDHADLGASLSSQILRVRHMRKWEYGSTDGDPPPVTGITRHDTTRRGHDSVYEFYDQSDDVPQEILPRMRYSNSPFPWYRYSYPHPVLCGRSGILKWLPDHMHEGEIIVPTSLSGTYTQSGYTTSEWPDGLAPEIIADATVIPHTDQTGSGPRGFGPFGPVNGKMFGVLGAYNGHAADVGRIVVDSTWHHWFDINLTGDRKFPVSNPKHDGFTATSEGLAVLDKIKNYFWNVGLWLSPPAYQEAMFSKAVYGLLWLSPINELSAKVPVYILGSAARDAIGRVASQCSIREWIWHFYPVRIREILDFPPIPNPPDPPPLRGLYLHEEFVLGGIVQQFMEAFPKSKRSAERPGTQTLIRLVRQGVMTGLQELVRFESQSIRQTEKLLHIVEQQLPNQPEPHCSDKTETRV